MTRRRKSPTRGRLRRVLAAASLAGLLGILVAVAPVEPVAEIPADVVDTDGDGIRDAIEMAAADTDPDGDGLDNAHDLDSDGDGLPDIVEAQLTDSTITRVGVDTDGDGADDAFDRDSNGVELVPVDTDGDGTPDYLDIDSDGDLLDDTSEAGLFLAGADADRDGLDDAIDLTDNGYVNPNGHAIEAAALPNGDTPHTGEVDFREFAAAGPIPRSPTDIELGRRDDYGVAADGSIDLGERPDDLAFAGSDVDQDGIDDDADIDDDNDGVPDDVESPDCFYSHAEVRAVFGAGIDRREALTASTGLPFGSGGGATMTDVFDGSNTTHVEFRPGLDISGEVIVMVDFGRPIAISDISFSYRHQNYGMFADGSQVRVEGSHQGIEWIDLGTSPADQLLETTTDVFAVTQDRTSYERYRLVGVSGTTVLNRAYTELDEITFGFDDFAPALHPKRRCPLTADVDLDGDSAPNHRDLDADGDGCSDGFEAGATADTSEGFSLAANVGANGIDDSFETSPDSGLVAYTLAVGYYAEPALRACSLVQIGSLAPACWAVSEAVTPLAAGDSGHHPEGPAAQTIDGSGLAGAGLKATHAEIWGLKQGFLLAHPRTTGSITYTFASASNQGPVLSGVALWASENQDWGSGDAPLRQFSITVFYGQPGEDEGDAPTTVEWTSKTYSTENPGDANSGRAQLFAFEKSLQKRVFADVKKVRVNLLSGWEMVRSSPGGAYEPQTGAPSAAYNLTLAEFRAIGGVCAQA